MTGPIIREERIGACRLIQGDCIEVMPLLGQVDAVVTDPPYGMNFQSGRRADKHRKIIGDGNPGAISWVLGINATHSLYGWMRWDNLREIRKPTSVVTWVKDNHSMGDLEHEHGRKTEVLAFFRGPGHFFPGGRPNDVIFCRKSGNMHHPTEKPVDLMCGVVSWTDGVVVDPFVGSGTSLVACAKLGRKGIGIELDPEYFDIACRRVEEAYRQPDLFVETPPPPTQEGFDL